MYSLFKGTVRSDYLTNVFKSLRRASSYCKVNRCLLLFPLLYILYVLPNADRSLKKALVRNISKSFGDLSSLVAFLEYSNTPSKMEIDDY
jgi:hypothetical protein